MDMNIFRTRLNELLAGGMSQAELERASGVDQTTISNIARGETKNPRAENLFKLMPHVFPEGIASPTPTPPDEARL